MDALPLTQLQAELGAGKMAQHLRAAERWEFDFQHSHDVACRMNRLLQESTFMCTNLHTLTEIHTIYTFFL